jgi:hypothetical protein
MLPLRDYTAERIALLAEFKKADSLPDGTKGKKKKVRAIRAKMKKWNEENALLKTPGKWTILLHLMARSAA